MKQSPFLLFILFLLITIYTGCTNGNTDGKIPFNESRAAESVIPIEQARQYQRNFITGRDTLSRSATPNFNLPNAESFTRDAIILLLNQENADGIRIYYGKDNAGMVRLVLLPVDKNGKDIQTTLIDRGQTNAISIPGVSGAYAAPPAEAQAVENGQTCPPCLID
jgi:hypothetical protein